jgi:hypothetical protein
LPDGDEFRIGAAQTRRLHARGDELTWWSGLEIVRKSLGRHEIATVQTTAIDCESGNRQRGTVWRIVDKR